jgi:hypothetical protein
LTVSAICLSLPMHVKFAELVTQESNLVFAQSGCTTAERHAYVTCTLAALGFAVFRFHNS